MGAGFDSERDTGLLRHDFCLESADTVEKVVVAAGMKS